MRCVSQIIVRYLDGRVAKGYTQDFDPDASCFHLYEHPTSDEEPSELRMEDLKALFLVRTLERNRHCHARRDSIEGDPSYKDRVEVTLGDGEMVRGSRTDPSPRRSGFFLLPPDSAGKEIMVFVISKG